jgi:hypothetical protein
MFFHKIIFMIKRPINRGSIVVTALWFTVTTATALCLHFKIRMPGGPDNLRLKLRHAS